MLRDESRNRKQREMRPLHSGPTPISFLKQIIMIIRRPNCPNRYPMRICGYDKKHSLSWWIEISNKLWRMRSNRIQTSWRVSTGYGDWLKSDVPKSMRSNPSRNICQLQMQKYELRQRECLATYDMNLPVMP